MKHLEGILEGYAPDSALVAHLMIRYGALMEEAEDLLDLFERLRQSLPEDLEWDGLDRDRIAEVMVDGLTESHRNSTVTYSLAMMSTFTLLTHGNDGNMICVAGGRDNEDVVLATITLARSDSDDGPLVIWYEITDPIMGQHSHKVTLPYDSVINRPKARLDG